MYSMRKFLLEKFTISELNFIFFYFVKDIFCFENCSKLKLLPTGYNSYFLSLIPDLCIQTLYQANSCIFKNPSRPELYFTSHNSSIPYSSIRSVLYSIIPSPNFFIQYLSIRSVLYYIILSHNSSILYSSIRSVLYSIIPSHNSSILYSSIRSVLYSIIPSHNSFILYSSIRSVLYSIILSQNS